jgi:hypothetical protein
MRIMPLSAPYNLVARTYHTIDHQLAFAEGDQYGTNSQNVAETVIACGFADVDPNPPAAKSAPTRADPPPEPLEPPHPAHKKPRH